MKTTWLDIATLFVAAGLSWWLVNNQGWESWWAIVVSLLLWLVVRRVTKTWLNVSEQKRATVSKLREIQVRNEREAAKVQDEMRAASRDVAQLSAEAELLAAEAQVRPVATPANIRTTVNVQSSNRTGVTLNGVHNPEGVWMATRSVGIGSSNTRIPQGSIIVFDGRQYHGQDGVLDIDPTQIQAAFRAGWFRRIEDPLDAPEAVLDFTAGSAMDGFAMSMRNFGNSIRRVGQPVRRTAKPPKPEPKEEPKEEPRRRSSWERLDDDDF